MEDNVKKMLRKAKLKQYGITILIVIAVILVMLPVGYFVTQKMSKRNSDRLNENLMNLVVIGMPNVELDSCVLDHNTIFGGEVTMRLSKNINGYIVPWTTYRGTYSWFTSTSDYFNLGMGHYYDEKNNYTYNNQTKQKEMEFYYPNVEEKKYKEYFGNVGGIAHELADVVEWEDHVVEMGISFDKAMSIKEVKEKIPDNLTIAWYWVDVPKVEKIEGRMMEKYGFSINKWDKYSQGGFDYFIDSCATFNSHGNNELLTYIVDENRDKKVEDVKLAGIVLTGQTKNFKPLAGEKWIRGASVGASAEIVPFIQPTK